MSTPATMLGLAIGDALGAPFETPSSATEPSPRLASWDGRTYLGTHGAFGDFRAGETTDDTGMAVMLAEALLDRGTVDPPHLMERYAKWSRTIPAGLLGGTIRAAMKRYASGVPAWNCGQPSMGNGTAMRAAPIGLFCATEDEAVAMARRDAALTHTGLEPGEASAAVAGAVAVAVNHPGWTKPEIIRATCDLLAPSDLRHRLIGLLYLQAPDLVALLREIGTRGHVLQTVPAAFACFLFTPTYATCIEAAIRAGWDTDTTAAIAGALAGTYYGVGGERGIPQHLIAGLVGHAYLQALDHSLYADSHR